MTVERTLCIIKPGAVHSSHHAAILKRIVEDGFEILAMRQLHMSQAQAGAFYAVHKSRPFFGDLVDFMSSGPVVVAALAAEDAVAKYRKLIGATNPAEAEEGTLRRLYGTELSRNAVHGSDSVENGLRETAFFFCGWDMGLELT